MLRGHLQVCVVQIASKEQFSAQLDIAERSSCSGRALGAVGMPLPHRPGMELDARSDFWRVLSDVFSWHGHVQICVCIHISAHVYICTVYVYGVHTFMHIYALVCTCACMCVPRSTAQCVHVWHMCCGLV